MTTSTRAVVEQLREQVSGRVVGPGDDGWERDRRAWNLHRDQRPVAVVSAAARLTSSLPCVSLGSMNLPSLHSLGDTARRLLSTARPGPPDGISVTAGRPRPSHRSRGGRCAVAAAQRGAVRNGADQPAREHRRHVGRRLHAGRWAQLVRAPVRPRRSPDQHHRAGHPNAEHVRISSTDDPELFWAMRGGGGEFVIVTVLELDLLPAKQIYGGRLMWSVEHAPHVFSAFLEATGEAPDELTLWAWLLNLPDVELVPEPLRGRWAVAVDVTYLGGQSRAERFLKPLRDVPPPFNWSLGDVPLGRLGDIAAEPTDPTPIMDDAILLKTFDESGIQALLDAVGPGKPSPLAIVEIRHLGGELSRPAEHHGAAGHLPEQYLLILGGMVPMPELAPAVASSMGRVRAALDAHSSGHTPPTSATTPPPSTRRTCWRGSGTSSGDGTPTASFEATGRFCDHERAAFGP